MIPIGRCAVGVRWEYLFDQLHALQVVEVLDGLPGYPLPEVLILLGFEGQLDEDLLHCL
jgi:hypothetical protein